MATAPGVRVGAPIFAELSKPVGTRFTLPGDSVGAPSTAVGSIAVTDIGYVLVTAGLPIATVESIPVGLNVTTPGKSTGEPNAVVVPTLITLSVWSPSMGI
jgi:hypothetical protein